MGTSDLLEKAGVNKDTAQAIETGEEIFSKVCWAYSAFKAVISLFEDEEENVLQQQLADIQNKLNAIKIALGKIEANQVTAELLSIAGDIQTGLNDFNGPGDCLFYHAKNYAINPEGPTDDPGGFKRNFFDACDDVPGRINNLMSNDHLWNHIFMDDALYSDVWSGVLKPLELREGNAIPNSIWDYRLPLPAFMEAIACWLIALTARNADYRKTIMFDNPNTLKAYAEKLVEDYERILAGFVIIRPPTNEELFSLIPAMYYAIFKAANWPNWLIPFPDENSDFFQTWLKIFLRDRPGGCWRLSDYIYGAVETYSGHACIANYPQAEIWEGAAFIDDLSAELKHPTPHGTLPNVFYEKFILRHTLRSWRQVQQLYLDIGLPNLRNTIQYLYSILGKSPPPIPSEYVKYTAWSVREVYSIIPDSIKSNLASGQSISLRSMATMLNAPSPVSVRSMFSLNE